MRVHEEQVLLNAEFDDKLKLYWFTRMLLILLGSIVGILAVPFWVLGLGQWYCRRTFESLHCQLQERTLVVKRGIYFRIEKTIPLDKIQDLMLKEGPLLRTLGLCSLRVETAGQSAQPGSSEAELIGVVNVREFRNAVLSQRDRIAQAPAPSPGASGDAIVVGLLTEIRDLLRERSRTPKEAP